MGRRKLAVVSAITLVGALLRFATLDTQSFWLDEAFTVGRIENGFGPMLSELASEEVHPPFYFALSWVWAKAFGSGEVGLRSLSALLGTATIPLAYVIAGRLGGFRVGCFAAALVATSPLLIWYSQEARGYALFTLLGGLSLLCFLAAKADFDRRWLAGWAASSALALATQYFAVFLVAPELLWLLVLARNRGALRGVWIAGAVVIAVGIALLPLALHQRSVSGAEWIANGLAGDLPLRIAAVPAEFITGRRAPHHAILAGLGMIPALLAVLPLLRPEGERARRAALAPLALAAGVLVPPILLAFAGSDYLITRNVIIAWIPLAIVIALGAAAASARRVGRALIAALCCLGLAIVGIVDSDVRYQRDDWRTAAEAVATRPYDGPRALVVTPSTGSAEPLLVYLPSSRVLGKSSQRVSEVDLLSLAEREPGEPPHTPRPPTPAPPVRGLKFVERVEGPMFTLVRYLAPRRVAVTAPMLADRALTGDRGAVLLMR